MKTQKLMQAVASGTAQFAAIHSICCGSQIVFAGMQVGISAASSAVMQGSSYLIAPLVAAGMAWGLPALKAKQQQPVSCDKTGFCDNHAHHAPHQKFKSFLTNTAWGYGVSFLLMASVTPSYEHKPQGEAKGLVGSGKMVIKVTDDTKIWPYSQRYFMNQEPVSDYPKITLTETSMLRAHFEKLKIQISTERKPVKGEALLAMDSRSFALAARMDKEDAAAFIKRKQNHIFRAYDP